MKSFPRFNILCTDGANAAVGSKSHNPKPVYFQRIKTLERNFS